MIRLLLAAITPCAALALVILFAAPARPRRRPTPIVPTTPRSGVSFLADLERRLQRVQPMVEREIGLSLGKVELLVLSRGKLERNAKVGVRERLLRIENGPRGEELLVETRRIAQAAWEALAAHVDHLGRIVFPNPNEKTTDWLALLGFVSKSEFRDDPRALDLTLIHELVHVHQHRHLSPASFLESARSRSDLRARSAIFEGHAEYLTRKIAEQYGMADLWEKYEERFRPDPDAKPLVRAEMRIGIAEVYFSYLQGRRFFSTWVERLGYESAIRRLFREPPSLGAVCRPEEYARDRSRSEWGPLFEDLRRWLVRERGEATLETIALQEVQAVTRDAADAFVEGYRLEVGFDVGIDVWIANDEDGARELFASCVDMREWMQDQWIELGGGHFTEVGRSIGSDGWLLRSAAPSDSRRKIERRGRFVFDVEVYNDTEYEQGAERLLRRAYKFLSNPTWRTRWLVGSKELLRSEDPDLRLAAVSRHRRFVPDEDWEVRWLGRWYEARDGKREESERIASLAAAVEEDHPASVVRGLRAFAELGLYDVPWPLVRKRLHHPRAAIRSLAWDCVSMHIYDDDDDEDPDIEGVSASDALHLILRALQDPDMQVRLHAAEILSEFEQEQSGLAAVFRTVLRDTDERVRYSAFSTLVVYEFFFPELLPDYVALIEESPEDVAEVLGNLGEAAREALPKLREALKGEKGQAEIAVAIWKISGDAEPLFGLVRKSIEAGRSDGLSALGILGSDALPIVPEVITALEHENRWIRYAAAISLGEIGGPAASAALQERLEIEPQARVRKKIRQALKEFESD